jgi:hypothetical protein
MERDDYVHMSGKGLPPGWRTFKMPHEILIGSWEKRKLYLERRMRIAEAREDWVLTVVTKENSAAFKSGLTKRSRYMTGKIDRLLNANPASSTEQLKATINLCGYKLIFRPLSKDVVIQHGWFDPV